MKYLSKTEECFQITFFFSYTRLQINNIFKLFKIYVLHYYKIKKLLTYPPFYVYIWRHVRTDLQLMFIFFYSDGKIWADLLLSLHILESFDCLQSYVPFLTYTVKVTT